MSELMSTEFHATTICAVQRDGKTAIAGDGQVTMGNAVIMKGTAQKVRRLYHGKIISGFAGSVADAFTLFDHFEEKLNEHNGNLVRSAVELAKDWRSDKILHKLEALLLVADSQRILLISGNGEVIEPDGDCTAIGSGGFFALAAARALVAHSALDAPAIAKESLSIAADICVYTNHHITVEVLES